MLIKPTVEEIVKQDLDFLRQCPHKLDCEHCEETICVRLVSVADFPTRYGYFSILGFVNNRDRKDHIIILKGDIDDGESLLCRIHSACLTGDALGSLRCDCGPQLHHALELIEREGRGLVLYHQEEGRGIGLVNKIRAYALQDAGYDTYDANTALGFAPDERDFKVPAAMLAKIGVKSVRLLINNPEKVKGIESEGIKVVERVPLELPVQEHNQFYLKTKQERFGHLLSLDHRKS